MGRMKVRAQERSGNRFSQMGVALLETEDRLRLQKRLDVLAWLPRQITP
jgi:hypothetical protein